MHHALQETVPPEIAEMILKPFDPVINALTFELKSAGFCDVRAETVSRPLIFEEGVEHAIQAMDGTPLAHLEKLPREQREAFQAAAKRHLKPLVWDDRVETILVSNIAMGHCAT